MPGDRPHFAHPSEEEFARLLDFYRIRWEYEPRTFVLKEDEAGNVEAGFSPDFFLPDFDLYIELTTKKPHLMDRKLRQVEALQRQYPDVQVKLLDRADFEILAKKLRARSGPANGGGNGGSSGGNGSGSSGGSGGNSIR